MKIFTFFASVAFLALSFFMLMHVKTDVQQLLDSRKELVKEQRRLKEDLRVLDAEFAHLSSPQKLTQWGDQMGFEQIRMEQVLPTGWVQYGG